MARGKCTFHFILFFFSIFFFIFLMFGVVDVAAVAPTRSMLAYGTFTKNFSMQQNVYKLHTPMTTTTTTTTAIIK